MKFLELFHDAHEQLNSMCHFTESEIFNDEYIKTVLNTGLSTYFDLDNQRVSVSRKSLGGTPSKHSELQLFSNLKAYFREKDIDISDVMDVIRASKRNEDPVAYWQLYFLVFSAFFIDHSQNDFLNNYFIVDLP